MKLRVWTDNIHWYQHSCPTFASIYFACHKSRWEKCLGIGNKETHFIRAMLLVNMGCYKLRMNFRILSSLHLSSNQAKSYWEYHIVLEDMFGVFGNLRLLNHYQLTEWSRPNVLGIEFFVVRKFVDFLVQPIWWEG